MTDDESELHDIPAAAAVGVFFCPAPECHMPHIMLYDEDGDPFAQFVVPELNPDGTGFLAQLTDALVAASHRKPKQ